MTLDIRSLFTGSAFDPCRMMRGAGAAALANVAARAAAAQPASSNATCPGRPARDRRPAGCGRE
jgi:hypothetical protein